MFLITTADERFWRTDGKVLFLGEWCRLFSQKSRWEKLSYEVLPYHWDDRKKLYQDYLYLDKLYEQMLLHLSGRLNRIHNVDHTGRYWRIIIGPWLYYFIQIFYDRYQSILTAEESGKVTNTLIGKYVRGEWLPQDYPEFQKWYANDDYNHYLYSRIIEYTNRMPLDILEVPPSPPPPPQSVGGQALPQGERISLKKLLERSIKLYEKFIPDCFNRITLISSYLNIRDLIKLQLSLKQFPYLFPQKVVSPESNIDWDLREKLSYESSGGEFEKLLKEMIKEQIPSIYLEGYAQTNQVSQDAYPRQPRAIFTANAYHANEAFKFWAAYHVDRGVKLAVAQHGGHYGTGLWSATENHEIQISDRFYTWGWKKEAYENTKPLSAAQLNKIKRNAHPKKDGRLLMVLSPMPRYSYYMCSTHVASSGTLAYFNDQYRFVRTLSKGSRELLLVRLYRDDYGWSEMERWACESPETECYLGNRSMLEQLNESRLFIGTYNATTYLETFVANFPTVLFWNPDHWELRPSAQPYFDELRRVSILHDTPESAARRVNEICDDPVSWWQQSEIQEAKDQFCHQFAQTSDNWQKEWKTELLNLALNSQNNAIELGKKI